MDSNLKNIQVMFSVTRGSWSDVPQGKCQKKMEKDTQQEAEENLEIGDINLNDEDKSIRKSSYLIDDVPSYESWGGVCENPF